MFRITFNSASPAPVVLLFFAVVIFLVTLAYRKTLPGRRNRVFFLLHIFSAILLFLAIFQPELGISFRFREKKPICVLIDGSLSMQGKDKSGLTKIARAKEFLSKNRYLRSYHPVFFVFGRTVDPVDRDKIPIIEASQNATRIGFALREVQKQLGDNCSGIVLLTDGQMNEFFSWETFKKSAWCPVYPVGIGEEAAKDISISNVISNSPVYEGETIRISVYIKQNGFDGSVTSLSLKEGNRLVRGTTVALTGSFTEVELNVPADSPGDFIYTVSVPPAIGEAVTNNNTSRILVRVLSPKIRVLYVDGGLRWEYKFLKRYLESDKKLETSFLVRVGEGTFQQTGGKQISVPSDIFGDSAFLANFDVIILGDIDFSGFSAQDFARLKEYVEEKGKSLLFLGGEHFLRGLKGSPLDGFMPVNLTGTEYNLVTERFTPAFTSDAKSQPAFENVGNFPPLDRANMIGEARKGSMVLLEKPGHPSMPLLVSTMLPRGKCAVFGADSTWKWAFGQTGERTAFELFWGRVIRLLFGPEEYLGIGDILPDIVTEKKNYGQGEEVSVQFPFKSGQMKGVNTYVKAPDGSRLPLEVKEGAARFVPDMEGVYIIAAEAGSKLNERDIEVTKEGGETVDPGRDEIFLRKLAEISDGRYTAIEDTGALNRILKGRRKTVSVRLALTRDARKYIIPLVFASLNTCWWLRRRNNIL
jgi:uncharacterized membrane protein